MVVLNYKVTINSRTIDIRRAGYKVRTYENAKVYLKGTAGRGKKHWAESDFTNCASEPCEITYFSIDDAISIAIHGNHVHVLRRNRKGKLVSLDFLKAEKILKEFVKKMRESGIDIMIKRA